MDGPAHAPPTTSLRPTHDERGTLHSTKYLYTLAQGCDSALTTWCDANCEYSRTHGHLLARYDLAVPRPKIEQVYGRYPMAWRCYAREALDWSEMRYKNHSSKAYCTRDPQIRSLIWQKCMKFPFHDAAQTEHWDRCKNATMTDEASANMAYEAVLIVQRNSVPGDIVEAGVWMGGLSCYMALAAKLSRRSWLLDTFEGLPAPTSEYDGADSKSLWTRLRDAAGWVPTTHDGHKITAPRGRGNLSGFCYASREDVEQTMRRSGQPQSMRRYVVGKVEETLASSQWARQQPSSIAILRLDTDWYESTRLELKVLWPLLSPGGWLYVDDYFAVAGARRAVDHWLQANDWEQHARMAGAFAQPRFALFKANPYDESWPFGNYTRLAPVALR